MKKRAICNIHSELDDLIDDILDLKILLCDKKDLYCILGKMRKLIYEATQAGQAMENRLKLYKEAIEGLGFIRDKDNKLKKEIETLKAKVFELENLPHEY